MTTAEKIELGKRIRKLPEKALDHMVEVVKMRKPEISGSDKVTFNLGKLVCSSYLLLLINLPCKLFMWFGVCCYANQDGALQILLDFHTTINLHKAIVFVTKNGRVLHAILWAYFKQRACVALTLQLPLLICKSFTSHVSPFD
jgi:hypothetical protein